MTDLKYILGQKSFEEVVICGDWNCDPSNGRFFQHAMEQCVNYEQCMSDVNLLPKDSFTDLCFSNQCSVSWSGHMMLKSLKLQLSKKLISVTISYFFELKLPGVHTQELHAITEADHTGSFWISWDKMSKEDNTEYAY